MKLIDYIKKLNNFFLEILAIFIGISISFWVENYREELSKDEMRKDVVVDLYHNLELDSIRSEYVSDSLIGDGLSYYPKDIMELANIDNAESVAYMLSYMNIYISFWQTKFAYNKLQNLQFEKALSTEVLERVDFYYQVINELHGLKRSDIAKEMFIERKAYLLRKGIYVSFLTTWDKIEHPKLDKDVLKRFRKVVLTDPEFEAYYYDRLQMFYDWQHSLNAINNTATELRKDLRAYYKSKYGKDIDKELGSRGSSTNKHVVISRSE